RTPRRSPRRRGRRSPTGRRGRRSSVLLVGRDGGLRPGLGGHLALAVVAPGFLMAVPGGAVVLDGVGDGAGAGGRHGDRGGGGVAGRRRGGVQLAVAAVD